MDFGNLVGQLLEQGIGGPTRDRVNHAAGASGLGGQSGLEDLLGGLMGGLSGGGAAPQSRGAASGGGLGDLVGSIGDMLGAPSGVGDMSKGQVGGIGALAGAILGGGGGGSVKGAVGGGAMALLGTLAMSALKNWQASQEQGQAQAATGATPTQLQVTEEEVREMTAPETAELCLKGMISAAKSDGQIGQDEMDRIVGKLEEGGVTEEERQLVLSEMTKPLDLNGLADAIPNRQVGAQVYAASLMAIKLDTPSEQAYMQALASRVGLDGDTVRRLHQLVGAG